MLIIYLWAQVVLTGLNPSSYRLLGNLNNEAQTSDSELSSQVIAKLSR